MKPVLRRLSRAPAFTVTVLLTLALGIAATAAVFAIVDTVLLRPLPYRDADRLVDLSHTLQVSGVTHVDQSDASFLYYRRASHTTTGVGAYASTSVNLGPRLTATAAGDGRPQHVPAARISAGTFAVLDVAPIDGRVFRDAEDRPDAPPVVLISARLWRTAYGAAPDIVGQRLDVDGVPRTVVGVMPASFRFPLPETEVWLPIGIDPAKTDSASFDYKGVARLAGGVSIAQAQADVQHLLLQLPTAFPGRLTASSIRITKMRAVVRPLRDVIVGDVRRVLWVVLGAVACLLLIGCANVTNLFMVRAEARQTEMAVRRALGAGRGAVAREVLSEGALLAAIGGGLGLALAAAGIRLLQASDTASRLPRLDEAGLHVTAVAVTCGITALVALLVAGVPALRAARIDGGVLLHDGGRAATAGRRRHRVRRALLATQIALALVLVASAGLMARSFQRLRDVRPGFDAAGVATFRLALPPADYPTHADAVRLVDEALDRLAALPGVQAAGAVTKLPLVDQGRLDTAIWIRDRPLPPGGFPNVHQICYVSPEYFRALSIAFVEGGTFRHMPADAARPEVILSDALVRRYWGRAPVVGRQVRVNLNGRWLTVVGVVSGVRGTSLEEPPDEMIYLPLAAVDPRWSPRDFGFVVRGAGAPAARDQALAPLLRRIAPAIPLYAARPLTAIESQARARTSFLLLLLVVAAGLALALGAVGIFGMSAYVVTLRRREIAIRLALGAGPSDVRRLVARQGLAAAAVGILAGLGGAMAVTRALAALLFGVSPLDPLSFAGAAATLAALAAVATWLPARHAARIDPALALRAE